eukprot:s989_g14.t1
MLDLPSKSKRAFVLDPLGSNGCVASCFTLNAFSPFWQLFQVACLAIPLEKRRLDDLIAKSVFLYFSVTSDDEFCCAGLGDIPKFEYEALLMISLKAGEDQERSSIRNAALRK